MHDVFQKLASIRPLEEDTLFDLIKHEIEDGAYKDEPESIEEGPSRRTPRKTFTKKSTSSQRRLWRRKKRLPTAKSRARLLKRKPKAKRRRKLLRQWRARHSIPQKPAGRGHRVRLSLASGNEQVANLFEEVKELVASIEQTQQEEMVRAYAQAALVADTLSERFLEMAESIAEGIDEANASDDEIEAIKDLNGLSENFEKIAEEAAQSAEQLHECIKTGVFNEEVNVDEVEEHFKGVMADLLDGCDFYASMTEDEDDQGEEVQEQPGEAAPQTKTNA